MPILTSLPSNVPSPAPPDKTLNKPPGTTLFDRIQQFKEISSVNTEIKEEKNFPVKMEDVNIKRENIQKHGDGVFRCQYCIFEGKTSYILQRHVIRHTGPLKCSKCNRGFSNAGAGKDYHKKHEESCDGSNPLPLLGEGNRNILMSKERMEERIPSIPQKTSKLVTKTFEENSSQIVKKEEASNPSQIIKKEEIPQAIPPTPTQSSARNSKFQEYFLKQCSKGSIGPAPLPVPTPVPKLIEDKPLKESAKRKPQKEEKKSPKKQPERNQFGPKGNKYEKFWCIGCDKWLHGGKANTTSHLRNHHEGEECPIIMITNQGMLKVDKEDFIMDKNAKRAKIEANDSSFNSTLNSSYDSSFNNSSSNSSFNDFSF